MLFFVRVICWNTEYILGHISRQKTYIQFLNNTFPIGIVIITYKVIIYGKFDLFIKILNFNNRVILVTILVIFERSYVVPHSCKVS